MIQFDKYFSHGRFVQDLQLVGGLFVLGGWNLPQKSALKKKPGETQNQGETKTVGRKVFQPGRKYKKKELGRGYRLDLHPPTSMLAGGK